jgi:two-component system, cell cycle sensor histidine kinase and response regulator CckA
MAEPAESSAGSEAELQELQKLEMLGLIAASLAHNFNNQLTSIVANVDDVYDESGDNIRVQAALAEIRQSAQQAGELCRQLVSYSRPGTTEAVVIDLSEMIVDTAGLLVVCLPKTAALQIACEPSLPGFQGNLNQIRQILINLMINAGSAMRETSGTVLLRTALVEVTSGHLAQLPQAMLLDTGNYLLVEVSDTGPGMDAESLQGIYQPFLTPDDRGKGLGLAVVQAIARSHGGFVHVMSAPGQGTVVQVYLPPVYPKEAEAAVEELPVPAEAPPVDRSMKSGTILLIDDDQMILGVSTKLIQKLGYQVVSASDGVLGVEKFLIHRAEITCVILDLNMPYMNGAETLKSLREAGCEAPVVIASGFSRLLITQEMRDLGIAAFLEKPYTSDMLGRTLEKVFNPSEALFL